MALKTPEEIWQEFFDSSPLKRIADKTSMESLFKGVFLAGMARAGGTVHEHLRDHLKDDPGAAKAQLELLQFATSMIVLAREETRKVEEAHGDEKAN